MAYFYTHSGLRLNANHGLAVAQGSIEKPDSGGDTGDFSLLGDPSFTIGSLTSAQRYWYDEFMATYSSFRSTALGDANSSDLYTYARPLGDTLEALLLVLRATGDLRMLDEVDLLTQAMRSKLFDGDCDGSNKDGFLNWRFIRSDPNHYCKDTHTMEEMLTHAVVARFAYAFHINQNRPSPGGINYTERAGFWRNYLENHFEAKWRQRSGLSWPRMDFLTRNLFHPQIRFIGYHYYMGQITGRSEYTTYARQLTDTFLDTARVQNSETGGLLTVPTPMGNAIVWAHRTPKSGEWYDYGQHGQYFRYPIQTMADLHAEGFYRWDQSVMQRLGVGLAYYFMDTDDLSGFSTTDRGPFAQATNGERVISRDGWTLGVNPTDRTAISRFTESCYIYMLPFMQSGTAKSRIINITSQAYPRRKMPQIPAAMLANEKRGA
jgi:hypothetical protein